MAQPTIKTSFASGEWAPKLVGRVDIQKYHAGAAFMRNFFVDYSGGGASTRQGTTWVNQCLSNGARIVRFQPSATLGFILEFGDQYIRFYSNASPILEDAVTGGTAASGSTFTIANSYNVGDWVFATNWTGLTNVNETMFIVSAATPTTVTVTALSGASITFTGTYSGTLGQLNRQYTINSPYVRQDLFFNPLTGNPGLKFVQDVNSLIITHPNYPPAILTELSVTNWVITNIVFMPTIAAPTGLTIASNLAAGTFSYGYLVTAVDAGGQESAPSAVITIGSLANIQTSTGTTQVAWTPVNGAVSYNVYACSPTVSIPIPSGVAFGFVGNVTGNTFTETTPGIARDFSQGPPITPSAGSGVNSATLTANAVYTQVPTVSVPAPPSGITAAIAATLSIVGATPSVLHVQSDDPTQGNIPVSPVGGRITLPDGGSANILAATFIGGLTYNITSLGIANGGSLGGAGTTAPTTFTPSSFIPSQPQYTLAWLSGTITLFWEINTLLITQPGSGYISAPVPAFSPVGATATTTIGSTIGGVSINPLANGNPGVPGFFQQRLVLAAPPGAVQTFYMSQPGAFFNFNTSFPSEDNDAIAASIIAEDLNDIRSLINAPTGMIAFCGKGAWLINGGGGVSVNNPVTPSNVSASPQAFNGSNDLPPIKINYDILYVTNKGNYVRDLSYSIYASIYTGSDISQISNHLFFNHYLLDWDWSEEPFKTLWAIREDGIALNLAYVKEQELIGWSHHDTDGLFMSVASVYETEGDTGNTIDAVYFVVRRTVNGQTFDNIERLADRFFPYGKEDAWCVDCGLQTSPAGIFFGAMSISGNASAVGNAVMLTDPFDNPFNSGMIGWIIRAGGGIYQISGFISMTTVTALVVKVPTFIDAYTGVAFPVAGAGTHRLVPWTLWTPVTVVSGITQLIGKTVTGLADGVVIPPQTVSAAGTITLSSPATKVTVGLAFTPQLKTLPLDLGEPTVQSKRKKLPAVTLRVADTLGLQVGVGFSNLVNMKDFQLNAIPSQANGPTLVTDLINTDLSQNYIDGYQKLNQDWQEPGQLCVQQNLPYPATIIAIIPEVTVGDTK